MTELNLHGAGACVLHCAGASPALSHGLHLSGYSCGAYLMLYLNKVDRANVLYRMGVPTDAQVVSTPDVPSVAQSFVATVKFGSGAGWGGLCQG